MVIALILTGGFATRLRPLTLTKPKALLPILDKPLLDWIIEGVKKASIKDVILSVRYLSHLIKSRYGDGSTYNVNIRYLEESKPLGDAGPLRLAFERGEIEGTFLTIYGDVFSDLNLLDLINYHKKKGGIATLALAKVEDPLRYGVVVLDDEGKVKSFIEKPKERPPSNIVNAGVYVFEPEVIKYIPSKYPSKISLHLIPKLLEVGDVYGYVHEGIWSDIGVPIDYRRANYMALKKLYPNGYIDKTAEIGDDVEIINPAFIGKNVIVGRGSKLGPLTVINEAVRIGTSCRIKGSIVMMGTLIDDSVVIGDSIIGEKSFIGKWVRIEDGVVLGDEVVIDDEVFIARNAIILPFKEVTSDVREEGKVVL
ncbi:MAG: nucleotidyl transferase [Desulfurococcales archaeon ex4484_42]|nr:MAG: nucleotidyl transferase [Desulfurococcales archaeon ex4484_42]